MLYKRDLDKLVRRAVKFELDNHVYLDVREGAENESQLEFLVDPGAFEVLVSPWKNTVLIQRGYAVERVSMNSVAQAPSPTRRPRSQIRTTLQPWEAIDAMATPGSSRRSLRTASGTITHSSYNYSGSVTSPLRGSPEKISPRIPCPVT